MTDYPAFTASASTIIMSSAAPMQPIDLADATALPDHEIPLVGMARHLSAAGLHWIPTLGWWREPFWRDASGVVHGSPSGSIKSDIVLAILAKHGWPLHDRRIAELSDGRIGREYMDYCRGGRIGLFRNIGYRMIVPGGEAKRWPVPMSPDVARRVLAVPDRELITPRDGDGYRIFRLMGKHGWADILTTTAKTGGRVRRAYRVSMTAAGRDAVTAMAGEGMREDVV